MEDKIEESYLKNFGMMIPKGVTKIPKEPFFKIYIEFGYWHIKIRKLRYPKLLDKLLLSLCKLNWHRWVGQYGYRSWSIPLPNSTSGYTVPKNETYYKCARCKKTKVEAR